MEKYLARFSPVTTFEELSTPLAVATTDINAGVSVYYSHGPIAPVVRASCAYPGLFVPIQYDGRTLVDGFLTAPVPVEGTLLLGADIVIAVYLEAGNVEERARSRIFSAARSTFFSATRSDLAHTGGCGHRAGREAFCVG